MSKATEATEFWERVLTTVRELDRRSYYDLLGIAQGASAEEIRTAYYRLIQTIHPDRHLMHTDAQKQAALVRLNARVGEAYRVLSSQERRRAYDTALASGKMRLSGTDETTLVARTGGADPKTPQGKALYQKGLGLLQSGDRKGAKAQWQLAIQFEPDSQMIRTALSNLAEEDRERPSTITGGPASIAAAGTSELPKAAQPASGASRPPLTLPIDLVEIPSSPGWEPWPTAGSGGSAPGIDRTRPTPPPLPPPPLPAPASAGATGPTSPLASGSQPGAIVVRCATADRTAALYERISAGDAVLVRTSATPAVGARVPVAVQLPDGGFVEVTGAVLEVRGGERPGVKLGFDRVVSDAAKQAFSRAMGRPTAAEDPARAGMAALAAHQYAAARDIFARALSRTPGDLAMRARYYLALGYEALQAGDTRQGELHIQTAEHFDPRCRDFLK